MATSKINIEATKLELMRMLLETTDVSKLSAAATIFSAKNASHTAPSEEERNAVNRALKSIEAGEGLAHKEVLSQIKARFPYLSR
jgi:hypothetical protein